MESFTRLTGLAAPLPDDNIDTDIIFPARFLLLTSKKGLGACAFHDHAHRPDGSLIEAFPLNQARFKGAPILVTGDNFGCGSSREHAPWALRDLGLRVIISTSFGEIFYGNCFKNGMLPIVVTAEQRDDFMAAAEAGQLIDVDLETEVVRRAGGDAVPITVENWRREALLNGWDEISMIINQDGDAIADFEARQRAENPWLYVGE
jgi:3-isopropylmalate dehydratase small subunit